MNEDLDVILRFSSLEKGVITFHIIYMYWEEKINVTGLGLGKL